MPITVSAPNQVAKVVVTTMISGRLRPATAKSAVFLMRVPAHTPRPSVPSRYSTTDVIRMVFIDVESEMFGRKLCGLYRHRAGEIELLVVSRQTRNNRGDQHG